MKPQDNKEFYDFYKTSKNKLIEYNLAISTLLAIYDDHNQQALSLEQTAVLLASAIQKIPNVHSVRWRVKEASHLISKIIRKHEAGSEKYKGIDATSYRSIVQDLVGLRALHLYKSNMLSINEEINEILNIIEGPIVYIRQGDSICSLEGKGFVVEEHVDAYRSVHYIVKSKPFNTDIFSELQVRTIFEEGWAEIDHDIRYPNYNDNVVVKQFLGIFNRLCGGADEMGDFVKMLTLPISSSESSPSDSAVQTPSQIKALREELSTLTSLMSSKNQLEVVDSITKKVNDLESSYSQVLAVSQNAVKDSYKGLDGWALVTRLFSDVITASAAAEKVKRSQSNIIDMGKTVAIEPKMKKPDDK